MTKLLELRERLRSFYYEYESIFKGAWKFLLSFSVFLTVISRISFLKTFHVPALAAGLAVVCIFLPASAISFLTGALIVVLSFGVSAEAGSVALIVTLLVVLLYFGLRPKYSILIVFTLIACTFNIGGSVPIAAALLCSPAGIVPMCIGIIYYDLISVERINYSSLASFNDRLNSVEKITGFLQGMADNRRALMLAAAFVLTFMIVWFLRRRPVSYAWSIAISVGLMVYILAILAASFIFDISLSIPGLIAGCSAGVLVALVVLLFGFTLDGSRTEYLEYEDDEYYYFVKAVPKMTVAATDRKVTRITGRRNEPVEEPLEQSDFPTDRPERLTETEDGGRDESH